MKIYNLIDGTFLQLEEVLLAIDDVQYAQPSHVMHHGTIGQHVRHIIELFQCLINGYDSGVVNYDNRKRDQLVETDRTLALSILHQILIKLPKTDKNIVIESPIFEDSGFEMCSNYYRELTYNLEHTIHHMALLKPAILEITGIAVSDQFGVAPSTLQYRAACAQ
jgi:hypothetical protein